MHSGRDGEAHWHRPLAGLPGERGSRLVQVVIADANGYVRFGVRAVLAQEPAVRLVGESRDAPQLLAVLDGAHPHVLLLDPGLPGKKRGRLVLEVVHRAPGCAVLIYAESRSSHAILAALGDGARGYVFKDAPTDHLLGAIRTVGAGGWYFDSLLVEPGSATGPPGLPALSLSGGTRAGSPAPAPHASRGSALSRT